MSQKENFIHQTLQTFIFPQSAAILSLTVQPINNLPLCLHFFNSQNALSRPEKEKAFNLPFNKVVGRTTELKAHFRRISVTHH